MKKKPFAGIGFVLLVVVLTVAFGMENFTQPMEEKKETAAYKAVHQYSRGFLLRYTDNLLESNGPHRI